MSYLNELANNGTAPVGDNVPTVIVAPASYMPGCAPNTGLSRTPASTQLMPSCPPPTCQWTVTLTAGNYVIGFGVSNQGDVDLLISKGVIPPGPYRNFVDLSGLPNNADLNFVNVLTDCVTYLNSCLVVRAIGAAATNADAQMAQPLYTGCIDVRKPLEPCRAIPTYPGCESCNNQPVVSFVQPIFLGCTNGVTYQALDTVQLTFTIVATDSVKNFVECGM